MNRTLRTALERIAAHQEIVLVALLVLTMAMMILPVPTALADVLIAVNIAISTTLMMVAIHIGGPVEFSTLPTLILITTAFRLSLSITTSRMVLVQGDAGEIIRTFGEFVIAGNVVVGLVVYLIITIVQFVVISKGSERVAEVAARFTLDALPGKQISIDTDLKNGDIDQPEAKRRRSLLERESQLFGAMDGAMKFVKGDSIASLIIIVVNLVGGMAIGCLQRGLSFPDAVQTYSLLAVGDGLIAQIPALLVSLTAGVIVTRTTSDAGGNLGQDIMAQVTAQPRVLVISAAVLAALGLVPGFPTAVFLTLAILLGSAGWALRARANRRRRTSVAATKLAELAEPEAARLELALGEGVGADAVIASSLAELRAALAAEFGIAVPRIRIARDGAMPASAWRLALNGVPAAEGTAADDAALAGAVRGAVARLLGHFVGIQETQRLLAGMEKGFADLVREASKAAPLTRIAEVLRRLLDDGVPIASMRLILESVAEWAPREPNTALLAEHVRVALRREICHRLSGPGKIVPTILIEASLDEALRPLVHATPSGTRLVLDHAVLERLGAALAGIAAQRGQRDRPPALLASLDLRRHLRAHLDALKLDIVPVSHGELPPDIRLDVLGTLRLGQVFAQQPARPARDAPQLVAVGR